MAPRRVAVGNEACDFVHLSILQNSAFVRRHSGGTWILHQKFEVPRWPWRIKAIVLVCESTTITNGVRDSGTGPARFPVRGCVVHPRPDVFCRSSTVFRAHQGQRPRAGDPAASAGGRRPGLARHSDDAGGDLPQPFWRRLCRGRRTAGARRRLLGDLARDREGFVVARRTAVAEEPLASRARAYRALAVGAVGLAGAVPRSGLAQGGRGNGVHSGGDGATARPLAGEPGTGGVPS